MENKTISIGTQTIDLDSLRKITDEELVKILETLYFDGYQQALKSVDNKINENIEQLISLKKETNIKKEQNESLLKSETPNIDMPKSSEGKIEINIPALKEEETDPLKKRMNEIAEMVYKFPKSGYVIYRYNGTEDEYLRSKYGFTSLPMKAQVFETEEEALKHKDLYWGSGYDELFIRKV
jgi:hypothetical protein